MSELWTDLNVLVLSNVGDSYPVARLLSTAGVNVAMFMVHDGSRGERDDHNIYHVESWRKFIKQDFPDLIIYDDVNLYHKWIRANEVRKGVPILFYDSGIARNQALKIVRELPVTVIASIFDAVSEPSTKWWHRLWGKRSA
jgi:hypothetical protein